jgi:hypothetical protein
MSGLSLDDVDGPLQDLKYMAEFAAQLSSGLAPTMRGRASSRSNSRKATGLPSALTISCAELRN